MLGSRITGNSFIPDLCASTALLSRVSTVHSITDIWETIEIGVGVVVSIQTVLHLAPVMLSLILGILKVWSLPVPPPSRKAFLVSFSHYACSVSLTLPLHPTLIPFILVTLIPFILP